MKTLCVAVVVLSLTSVCQSVALTCEQLKKPLDLKPDVSGRWYVIAVSSEYCVLPGLFNSLFWPSVAVDLTAQASPIFYTANYTFHMYEYCSSLVNLFALADGIICEVDRKNDVTDGPKRLLYTSCPDCLFLKSKNDASLLFSRRKNITDAELKEFEALSKCLGFSKLQVLNTDHEHLNCKSLDLTAVEAALVFLAKIVQRIQSSPTNLFPSHCIDRDDYNHPPADMEAVQEAFKQLLKLLQH